MDIAALRGDSSCQTPRGMDLAVYADAIGFPIIGFRPPCLTHLVPRNNIVITMKVMHVSIRRIGNSQGIVIPKPVLTQLGLSGEEGAEMAIEGGALVLRRPASPVRTGWAAAARKIAEAGDDKLVMSEFGNAADTELAW